VTPDDPDPLAGAEAPVPLPIEDSLDLHAFAPRDVRSVVEEYLRAAAERGFTEVRVIHGRGIGAQRQSVRQCLAAHPLVAEFHDAPPDRGGWGATVVRLRPPR
jgi:DNA-nicking Smr family endonuclease